ncbi:MAG: type II secretion system protein [Gammaproteobacteria bacterium]|nr:type II secretion system protein [Gammaproteobacteria bacterium]
MRAARQSGLTLIEMVLTILILSIALVMISAVLSGGLGRSSDTTQELRSVALAQSYLDEILGKRFDENSAPRGIPPCSAATVACTVAGSFGPDGGELREDYDDVDDYHGLDEGDGQVNPLQDAEGATRTGYDNFRVQISVRYIDIGVEEVNLGVAANDLDDNEDAKLITVTVSYTADASGVSYSAYKANF